MSKCSPRYIENGKTKNTLRMEGNTQCDCQCIHWRACKEELNGGSDRVMKLRSQNDVEGRDNKRVYNLQRLG